VWLDPDAARRVIQACPSLTLIPLDLTRRLILSPSELLDLPNPDSRTCQFLRKVIPFGIRASSNLYGIEGFHIKDVLGVAAAALPGSVTHEPKAIDVETKGQITRGMTVVDDRGLASVAPNAQLATGAAIGEIRQWIEQVLKAAP
jgi:inosine-uridine nucleoside N-ribohydrolase